MCTELTLRCRKQSTPKNGNKIAAKSKNAFLKVGDSPDGKGNRKAWFLEQITE